MEIIYELFSKRQKRIRGDVPDVYQYDNIPHELRVQIFYIWQDVWGEITCLSQDQYTGSRLAFEAYRDIETTLCREYGVLTLVEGDDYFQRVRDFFFDTEETDKVIDVIELSFQYIDEIVREEYNEKIDHEKSITHQIPIYGRNQDLLFIHDGITPDDAITQLNYRFREHGVGYQFESGEIIKVDSQFIHSEMIKHALSLLSDPIYKGANEEFLNAHQHYRKGNYKECVNDCLNAFESCLKIICKKNRWNYSEKDTANRLIEIVFKHNLIDPLMMSHFTALRSTLESGVPTVRNRLSGHGQGPEEIIVPEYIAAYIFHLTASNILFLAKADEELR